MRTFSLKCTPFHSSREFKISKIAFYSSMGILGVHKFTTTVTIFQWVAGGSCIPAPTFSFPSFIFILPPLSFLRIHPFSKFPTRLLFLLVSRDFVIYLPRSDLSSILFSWQVVENVPEHFTTLVSLIHFEERSRETEIFRVIVFNKVYRSPCIFLWGPIKHDYPCKVSRLFWVYWVLLVNNWNDNYEPPSPHWVILTQKNHRKPSWYSNNR